MKPVSDQPPLPLPPRQGDVPGVIRWAGDLTRQLFTYLRELSLRLNHALTDDNIGLKTIADADLTADEAGVLTDIADGTTPSGGDVVGPASAVDGRVAAFDGTTGKLIKDSGAALSDYMPTAGGTFTGPVSITTGHEIIGGAGNMIRLKSAGIDATTGYGIIWRVDTTATYILQTAVDDPNGSWSTVRPFTLSHTSGLITVAANPVATLGIATKGYVDAADAALSARITALGG